MRNIAGSLTSMRRAEPPVTFPEWAVREVERLLSARASARSREERYEIDLQLAVLCGAAERFGRSLTEAAEL